MSPAQAAPKT
uniref:Uncharacterized protein n=1 Tax=Anguilla anguilla TaxID=7936 RepID=A0A0E9XN11_ANGAN